MYKNDAATIGAAHQGIQLALQRNNSAVPVKAAACESFLDEHFDELLQNNVPLPTLA